MPFNLTGTTISQTGTDANLSDLTNITGVTATVVGTGGGAFTIYNLGENLDLNIGGTLSHDPESEVLVLGTNGSVIVNGVGTYNYGREISPVAPAGASTTLPAPVGDRFSAACGLTLTNSNASSATGSSPTTQPFVLLSGGTFNWQGGEIACSGAFQFREGGIATIRDGVLRLNAAGIARLENGPTLDVDGLRKVGGFLFIQNGVPTQFARYNPEHSNNVQSGNSAGRNPYAMLVYGAGGTLTAATTIANMTGTGNQVEAASLDNGYTLMLNPESGIGLRTDTWGGNSSLQARSDGRIEQRKDVQFNIIDLSNNSTPAGVNYHMRDVNAPGRPVTEARIARAAQTPPNSPIGGNGLQDQVLVGVSNAQGVATAQPIYRLTTSVNNNNVRDLRCNADGTMPFTVYGYLYNTQTPTVSMNGTGTEEALVGLSRDENITVEDSTVVSAYNTRITVDLPTATITIADGETASLDELYDYFKFVVTTPDTAGQQQLAPIEYTLRATETLGITNAAGAMQLDNFSLVVNGNLTNGTTFSSLDAENVTLGGTAFQSGSLSNLTITNLANNQVLEDTTNVNAASGTGNQFRLRGDASGGTFSGSYRLNTGSTVSGGITLDGATEFQSTPYTLTGTSFGPNFTVAAGTGNIIQGLDTDFQMMVGSVTARSLLDAAGFTTIVPPVSYQLLLTLPTGTSGNVIVRNITDNSTANTGTIANGAVTWATASNINNAGNATYSSTDNNDYRVYIKLNSTFGSNPTVFRTSITSFSELTGDLTIIPTAENPFFFDQQGGFMPAGEVAVVQSFSSGDEFIDFRYNTLTAEATANGTQASVATAANTLDYLQFVAGNNYEIDPVDYGQFSVVFNNEVNGITGLTASQGIFITSQVQTNQTILSNVGRGFRTQQVGTRTTFVPGTGVAQVIGQDANEASIGTVAAAVAVALNNSTIENRTAFLVGSRLGTKGSVPYSEGTNYTPNP